MIMINVALDAMGIAVSMTLLVGALLSGQKQERRGWFFVLLLILTMVQQASDMVNWLCEAKPEWSTLLFAVNFVIFICGPITALFFYHYVLATLNANLQRLRWLTRLLTVLCAVWILMNVINIFNNMFYGVDSNGSYYRGPIYLLEHVYHFIVILLAAVLSLLNRKLSLRHKFALLTYALLPFAALLFQVQFYGLSSLTYCALTLSMLLIYITVHLRSVARLEQQGVELKLTRQAYQATLYDAETDDLTGLLKRKILVREAEKRLAADRDTGCAIWMIDLDRFKDVNDQFGHSMGDQVLIAFSNKLAAFFPEGTPVARYGGDEFCVFQPQTTLEELYNSLQHALAEFGFICENGSKQVQIAASIGAAYVPPEQAISYQELFDHADKALYTSKNNGRRQYSVKEL